MVLLAAYPDVQARTFVSLITQMVLMHMLLQLQELLRALWWAEAGC